jgi:hypothetical protein
MVTEAVLAIVLLGHAAAAWAIPLLALEGARLPQINDPTSMQG